ncbi:flavodoxin domain-containing protein [Vallitalea sediminicola]
MDTIIVYESKYGSTKEIAKDLAMVLGPATYCTTDEWKDEYKNSDYIIIGTPIYGEKVNPKIYDFVYMNREWLSNKKVFLFCVSLRNEGAEIYLTPLKDILKGSVVSTKAIGGRLLLNQLDNEDYTMMKNFSNAYGMPFQDVDSFDIKQITEYGLYIRKQRDYLIRMPIEELKIYIEEFLGKHNTCALATGYDNEVRATPVEYTYNKGHMYILSEGGFKFANILLNDYVSITVYDSFQGMNTLAGLQMTGKAEIIEDECEEYLAYLRERGIRQEKLPSPLHLISIKIEHVEILSSELKKRGYGVKQYYNFLKET